MTLDVEREGLLILHASEEALSISNLEKHLATLLERTNYGLDASDLGLEPEAKIPPVSQDEHGPHLSHQMTVPRSTRAS